MKKHELTLSAHNGDLEVQLTPPLVSSDGMTMAMWQLDGEILVAPLGVNVESASRITYLKAYVKRGRPKVVLTPWSSMQERD